MEAMVKAVSLAPVARGGAVPAQISNPLTDWRRARKTLFGDVPHADPLACIPFLILGVLLYSGRARSFGNG
jgi:hypothetical protein